MYLCLYLNTIFKVFFTGLIISIYWGGDVNIYVDRFGTDVLQFMFYIYIYINI